MVPLDSHAIKIWTPGWIAGIYLNKGTPHEQQQVHFYDTNPNNALVDLHCFPSELGDLMILRNFNKKHLQHNVSNNNPPGKTTSRTFRKRAPYRHPKLMILNGHSVTSSKEFKFSSLLNTTQGLDSVWLLLINPPLTRKICASETWEESKLFGGYKHSTNTFVQTSSSSSSSSSMPGKSRVMSKASHNISSFHFINWYPALEG